MAREMKDSGIAWIGKTPDNWGIIKFKYLHNGLNTGEGIDKEFWSSNENDLLFYTAGLEPIRTNYRDFPDWKYTNINDLLLARNGTPYVYLPKEGSCYTDHIIRASIKSQINRRFVQYCLQQSISSVVVDSVSLATWSASLWNTQIIPWPSELEQSRIVAFLDAECDRVDAVIEQTRASIEEYKKLKQSVITEAVTKGIRKNRPMKDSGIEWIGGIPAEWECKRTKFIANSITKGNGITKEDVADDGDIQCVRYGEIYSKYEGAITTTVSATHENIISAPKYLNSGDILFAGTGELIEEIGKNVVYIGTEPCLAGGDIIVLNHFQNPIFLNYALNSQYSQMQKSRNKTKLKVVHISAGDIGNVIIALPPIDEQEEIGDYLDKKCDEINIIISSKESLIKELETYKKSLIFEYVTGKKEVTC